MGLRTQRYKTTNFVVNESGRGIRLIDFNHAGSKNKMTDAQFNAEIKNDILHFCYVGYFLFTREKFTQNYEPKHQMLRLHGDDESADEEERDDMDIFELISHICCSGNYAPTEEGQMNQLLSTAFVEELQRWMAASYPQLLPVLAWRKHGKQLTEEELKRTLWVGNIHISEFRLKEKFNGIEGIQSFRIQKRWAHIMFTSIGAAQTAMPLINAMKRIKRHKLKACFAAAKGAKKRH
eukprot:806760_1